jgi:hypothetical protein
MKDHMIHLKHVLIAAGVLLVVWMLGWRGLNAWKDVQANIRVRDVKIDQNSATVKANETTVATAQKTVEIAQASNKQLDAERDRKLNALQAQLDSKPDSEQIKAIIKAALPSLTGVTETTALDGTRLLSVPDTQENRDAINKTDVAFKSCRFSLDDCTAVRKNFEEVIVPGFNTQIAALNGTIAAQKNTIELQKGDIADLKSFGKGGNIWARTGRVLVPLACAGGGAYLASKHQQGQNSNGNAAAIGALVGGGVCAITFHF